MIYLNRWFQASLTSETSKLRAGGHPCNNYSYRKKVLAFVKRISPRNKLYRKTKKQGREWIFLFYGTDYFLVKFFQKKLTLFHCINNCCMEVLQPLFHLLNLPKTTSKLCLFIIFKIFCTFDSSLFLFQNMKCNLLHLIQKAFCIIFPKHSLDH